MRSDQANCVPVGIGIVVSASCCEPVSHHIGRWHRVHPIFRSGERQTHISTGRGITNSGA